MTLGRAKQYRIVTWAGLHLLRQAEDEGPKMAENVQNV